MASAIEVTRQLAASVRELASAFGRVRSARAAAEAAAHADALADAIRRGQAPELLAVLRDRLRK